MGYCNCEQVQSLRAALLAIESVYCDSMANEDGIDYRMVIIAQKALMRDKRAGRKHESEQA